MYQLPVQQIAVLSLSLLLGTPILIFLGAIVAALTVSLRNSGLLLALILLPLYIPPLIFGASSVLAMSNHLPVLGIFAILGVMLILSVTFAPMLAAFALRITLAYD